MTHIDDEIRRITIDLNQAGNYYSRHNYKPFLKNLNMVLKELNDLVKQARKERT